MKKILVYILLLMSVFMLASCTNSNDSKTIMLHDAFSITPYINIIGKTSDIKKYDDQIYNDLSDALIKLDDKFSVGKENSIVSLINNNKEKEFIKADTETLYIIRKAIEVSEATKYHGKDSKYDITIYPLVEAWGFMNNYFHGDNYSEALSPNIAKDLAGLVGYSKIIIQDDSIRLQEVGMKIDLGSIVKGYACDVLSNIMNEKYPYFSYIINIGGNIYTYGQTKRDGKISNFHIGIQTPFYDELSKNIEDEEVRNNAYYIGYINGDKEGTTVVTSGIYERYIKDKNGNMYHHILDKETGYPIDNDLSSITIIIDGSNSSISADAYSTALFGMGSLDAISYANENNMKVVAVTKDNKIYTSDSCKDNFVYNELLNNCGFSYNIGNNQ